MPDLDYSYIANAHPEFIENLYNQYKENPNNVESDWKNFFEGFDFAADTNGLEEADGISPKEFQVLYLINAYRRKGHLEADTNPIRQRKELTFNEFV